jgi:plasmid maintenance system antidote protein VapI
MTTLPYSFSAVHPGEILKEELQTRGISQKK